MSHQVPKILILGIGNILLRDEGVGVRVIERLQRDYRFHPNIEIFNGGTAGLGILNLLEGVDYLIIVDAIDGKNQPGSLYRFKFEDIPVNQTKKFSPHQIGILETLTLKKTLDKIPDTTIIAIQPKDCNNFGMELTPEIENKIPDIINLVMKELRSLGIGEFNSLTP
ncbi:MAG: HyaD/HybD family hydrogenase maturation endopeptidase [Nitrospinota bacterium]